MNPAAKSSYILIVTCNVNVNTQGRSGPQDCCQNTSWGYTTLISLDQILSFIQKIGKDFIVALRIIIARKMIAIGYLDNVTPFIF